MQKSSSLWYHRDFAMTGVAIVLVGATVLVLRAYLPRWVFGGHNPVNWLWPVTIFASYVVLGLVALISVRAIDIWFNRRTIVPLWRPIVVGTVAIVMATGTTTGIMIAPLSRLILGRDPSLIGMWTLSSVLATTAYICFLLNRASVAQREQAFRLQLEAGLLGTALAEAELSTLEAQIEPHFLFNTLAHVKRQYRINAAAADQMLAALIDYLDRALPALKRTDWTLGDELDLIQVYLEILTQRFGARFRFSISAFDKDRTICLPALTVVTLVENAIRHGLGPKSGSGFVSIHAESENAVLVIEVCDDGVGLRQSSGSGLGLASIRARLQLTFGDMAVLKVEPRHPDGVRSSIRIPTAVCHANVTQTELVISQ